ncbi:helix-turn-helix domain-containing protein [Nesterenkonia sp. CF4.4]|uniref:helix-turn-helix domain-containing protein n=1 Tax=Nesterenkonia sp. CF4.4 TaxID=3373079 RepID=UPI003EE72F41
MHEEQAETSTDPTQAQEQAFVRNILKERDRRGMTQGAFATYLRDRGVKGMHQTTLSRMENGSRPLKLREAIQIADALKVPLGHLLTPPDHVAAINGLFDLTEGLDGCLDDMTQAINRALSLLSKGAEAIGALDDVSDELVGEDDVWDEIRRARSSLEAYVEGGLESFIHRARAESWLTNYEASGDTNGEY